MVGASEAVADAVYIRIDPLLPTKGVYFSSAKNVFITV